MLLICLSCDDQSTSIVNPLIPITQSEIKGKWIRISEYKKEVYKQDGKPDIINMYDRDYDSTLDKYYNASIISFTDDSMYEYIHTKDTMDFDLQKEYELNGTDLYLSKSDGSLKKTSDVYKEDDILVIESYETQTIPWNYSIHEIKKYVKYNGDFPPKVWYTEVEEDIEDSLKSSYDSIIVSADTLIPGSLYFEDSDSYYLKCEININYLIYVRSFVPEMEIRIYKDSVSGTAKEATWPYEEYDYGYGLNDQVAQALIWESTNEEIIHISIKSEQSLDSYYHGYYEIAIEETDLKKEKN